MKERSTPPPCNLGASADVGDFIEATIIASYAENSFPLSNVNVSTKPLADKSFKLPSIAPLTVWEVPNLSNLKNDYLSLFLVKFFGSIDRVAGF